MHDPHKGTEAGGVTDPGIAVLAQATELTIARHGGLRFEGAKRALAEAVRVDEVKHIRDKALAMAVYARQAKDGQLIAMATEIRRRAERRLGEIMAEDRKAGRLAKPPNPKRRVARKPDDPPTLAEQGVDKNLADRARKAAAMPEGEFESTVATAVKVAVSATEDDRGTDALADRAKHRPRQPQKRRKLLDAVSLACLIDGFLDGEEQHFVLEDFAAAVEHRDDLIKTDRDELIMQLRRLARQCESWAEKLEAATPSDGVDAADASNVAFTVEARKAVYAAGIADETAGMTDNPRKAGTITTTGMRRSA